ncbi:MAG: hypothetical protein M3Z41_07895 [Candidatus Eremiobacteraeota bacterium]|nr:hypothetical protein [Candidatus Eremiobacteraeota bacterium]
MVDPSRDDRAVHARATKDVRFIRATANDAAAVANFLRGQDVRPAPSEADVASFLGRTDTLLFFAIRADGIEGLASRVHDGAASRLAYFAIDANAPDELAASLIHLIESDARAAGAGLLAAQALRDSQTYRRLLGCGFQADWEEQDAFDGHLVAVVDLVKVL